MLGMKNGFQLLSRLLLSDRTENTDDVLQYSKILKNSAMTNVGHFLKSLLNSAGVSLRVFSDQKYFSL